MRYFILIIALISSNLYPQNIDGYLIDALRYSSDDNISNTRSSGLGFSYLGVINDQGAIYYNPAGLTLSSNSEISTGFNYKSNSLNSIYQQSQNSNSYNDLNITNIGISSPVETYQNSEENYYLCISYSNNASYDRNIEISSFNSNKSYSYNESVSKRSWTEATKIGIGGFSFIEDSLFQNYKLTESGSSHKISLAIASEFGSKLSIGGTMNISFGSFDYTRFLDETDVLMKYQDTTETPPYPDFDKLFHTLEYNQSFTSINFNFGIMYNPSDNIRLTINVLTPSSLRVEEYYYEEAEVKYDDGSINTYNNLGADATTIYDMSLPWSISLGASYNVDGLTIAYAFQFKDNSFIKFLEAEDDYLLEVNQTVHRVLKSSFKSGLGIEYDIPFTALQLRSGITLNTSPIEKSNDLNMIYSTGMSIFIIEQLRLDLFGQYSKNNNDLYIYDDQRINIENEIISLGFGFTYRY